MRRRHGKLRRVCALLGAACGGGSGIGGASPALSQGTPAGTYSLTITGTSGSLSHAAALTLTVQ